MAKVPKEWSFWKSNLRSRVGMGKGYYIALLVALLLKPVQSISQTTVFLSRTIDACLRETRPDFWRAWEELATRRLEPWTIADWTKISDLVVIGEVKKIEGHPESVYHTWLTVQVDTVLKGIHPQAQVMVKILSGPVNNKGMHTVRYHDAKFTENERVLLFLSTIPVNLLTLGKLPGLDPRNLNLFGLNSARLPCQIRQFIERINRSLLQGAFILSTYLDTDKTINSHLEIWDYRAKWQIRDGIAYRQPNREGVKLTDLMQEIKTTFETTRNSHSR